MASFFLHLDCIGEIDCPYCKATYEIEWQTEYGEPVDGDEDCKCQVCGRTFMLGTEVRTTYTTYTK